MDVLYWHAVFLLNVSRDHAQSISCRRLITLPPAEMRVKPCTLQERWPSGMHVNWITIIRFSVDFNYWINLSRASRIPACYMHVYKMYATEWLLSDACMCIYTAAWYVVQTVKRFFLHKCSNWTVNNYLIMVKYMRYISIARSGNFQYNVCVVAETTQVIIKAKFHKYVLSRLYIYYIHKLCWTKRL